MKVKTCFIAVLNEGQTGSNFEDFRHDKRVTVINSPLKPINNRFIKLLRKIHISPKIFNVIKLPFKNLWTISLDDIVWKDDTQYLLFFSNTSIYPMDPQKLIDLQKKHNVKLIMYLLDAWNSSGCNIGKYYLSKIQFDYIFTIDNNDAERYGFIFSDMGYSMSREHASFEISKSDLYFVGFNKGRLPLLLKIIDHAVEYGVNAYFRIPDIDKKSLKKYRNVISDKPIAYSDSLNEMLKSNCILEILTEGQSGATLRYYEAVCYNKKLLTNNKNVIHLPFYDPDKMHIFSNAEDIDFEWIMESSQINYHYDGRFSPSNLLDKVVEMEMKNNSKEY